VYLARWQLLRSSARAPEVRSARRAAQRAVFDLLTLALSIPIGWPYYHRSHGEMQRLDGNLRTAAWAFERGRAAAHRLGMPHDEALAHLDLARVAAPGSRARAQHAAQAEAMLERLACPLDLERARQLRQAAHE
jgi:hypothetical protein